MQRLLQHFLWWFSSPENTVLWIDIAIQMEVGLITESNIVNPVVVFCHLVIKPIAQFYSWLSIFCSKICFTWMWYGKSFKSSFNIWNVLIQLKDNYGEHHQQDIALFWVAASRNVSMFCWALTPLISSDLPLLTSWAVISVWNFFTILHIVFLSEAFQTAKCLWYCHWAWTINLVWK